MEKAIIKRRKRTVKPADVVEPVVTQETVSTAQEPQVEQPAVEKQPEVEQPVNNDIIWQAKKPKASKKPILTECIVIDKYSNWHEGVKLELKGMDTTDCKWGYYDKRYPVFTEIEGKLVPYIHTDIVGESSSRLWKGVNPNGFRNTFRHLNTMMQKVALGLMAGVVIGILGLIYVMIS